jgi:hypothetical protein
MSISGGATYRFATSLLAVGMSIALATPAYARADFHDLSAAEAAESELGKQKLLDVPYYLSGHKHRGVASDLGTFKSNRRTNAFAKSDEDACRIAYLSAVIALQKRAQQLGGDGVIEIKSITRNNELVSASQYRCVAGAFVANVALSGQVVKFK